MNDGDLTYKSQDVSYLGFLEGKLRDLQGIETLVYEFVQNADDAQATHITFNVTDAALVIENDAVFRDIDFERLQRIASGGKRQEVGTTGAFGLGFIAVYQVTDAPEIFSNGRHWLIRPEAETTQRIIERPLSTTGTQFRLPWAFAAQSPIRQALRLAPIVPTQLDGLASTMAAALPLAALFGQHLQRFVVKRNGRLVAQIERQVVSDEVLLLLDQAGDQSKWYLFRGEFEAVATQLRQAYGWQIEAKRHSRVQVALSAETIEQGGRLFAGLPTASRTPLPFHINADFFPTSDRKHIHFGEGYQALWNEAALECGAEMVAAHVAALPTQLTPVALWQWLHQVAEAGQLAQRGQLPTIFATFWQALTPLLPTIPLFYTVSERWCLPREGRLVAGKTAVSLLTALKLPAIHPTLLPYSDLMRQPELGVPPLAVADVAEAVAQLGLTKATPLHEAPAVLRDLATLQALWQLIDRLLSRLYERSARETALTRLTDCAIVLTDQMVLMPFKQLYRGKREVKLLFPTVAWLHEMVPTIGFPGDFVPLFGVRQATDLLAEMPLDQLEKAWLEGGLDIPGLFRWLEGQQIEIFADDPALRQVLRQLPLMPVAGALRPLAHLYLPGGFEDPLQLATVVDVEAVGGRRQFLRDLGVQQLDFDTYVHLLLPTVLTTDADIPSDARHALIRLLAGRLGEMQDDPDLQAELSRLPLVACMDGSFRAGQEMYGSREVMLLLGEGIHIAEPAPSKAIAALYRWLGVRETPPAERIVAALLQVSQAATASPLPIPVRERVRRCWLQLNVLLTETAVSERVLTPLLTQRVVPDGAGVLQKAQELVWVDQADLATQFSDWAVHLLPDDAALAAVWAAMGIRPLSQAVAVVVTVSPDAATDVALHRHILERQRLIERMVKAEQNGTGEPIAVAFLAQMVVIRATEVRRHYALSLATADVASEPQVVAAAMVTAENRLYVRGDEPVPWAMIARELAMVITGKAAVGALALGIKTVLATATLLEAAQLLDDLGYA